MYKTASRNMGGRRTKRKTIRSRSGGTHKRKKMSPTMPSPYPSKYRKTMRRRK